MAHFGKRGLAIVAVAAMAAALPRPASAQERTPPYWASIDATRAIMRRGPSQQMRAMWEYRRPGLPVRVVAIHDDWREVEEPDGTRGWMHRSLLNGRRTAIVTGTAPQPVRAAARANAAIAYRAAPGVLAHLLGCADGWCEIDLGNSRRGYISADAIWGD